MTGRTNAGGGIQLPALTNPAAAANIQSGYQAINGEGEVVTGTASVLENGTITVNNVSATRVYLTRMTSSGYSDAQMQGGLSGLSLSALAPSFFSVRDATLIGHSVYDISVSGNLEEVYKDEYYALYYFSGGNASVDITD